MNHSLTYAAEEERNADGEELLTHVLSYTHELYMSDTGGIIGRIPTWIFYVISETFDYVISYTL